MTKFTAPVKALATMYRPGENEMLQRRVADRSHHTSITP